MQKIAHFIQSVLTPMIVLMIGGVVALDHFSPRLATAPTGAVDGKALGRAYAPVLASCLSEGWLAAADAIEQGKSVPEAQAALQSAWHEARAKAFSARVAPEFSRVLPEGAEPADPSRRAEVIRLWRDFASGLKGGR